MNNPRDPSKLYGQKSIGFDFDRRHTRGGPPQGPRSGASMINRKMPDYHEAMDDLNDEFDNMGMDSRKYSAFGRPQGRADMGRRRMNDMDGFGEDEVDHRESSTRGRPQDRRGIGSGYVDKPVTDMISYVPKGSRAGGSLAGGSLAGGSRAGGSRAGGSIAGGSRAGGSRAGGSLAGGSRTGVGRAGAGDSRAGGKYGDMTDDMSDLHVPRCIRGSRPPTTNSSMSLRDLEAELDRAEESKLRSVRAYQTSNRGDFPLIEKRINEAIERIFELEYEIYKIDPKSKRVNNTARLYLRLPKNPDLESR